MSLRIIEVDDPAWDLTVNKSSAPFFYSAAYNRFCSAVAASRPIMLLFESPEGFIFDVTIAKNISALPFFASVDNDFTTPPIDLESADYNGPIAVCRNGGLLPLLQAYRRAVDEYCSRNSVVTEFVRFHPLAGLAPELGGTIASSVIYVDLRSGYEVARQRYRHGHKSTIKKAQREGARVEFVVPTKLNILRLASLYQETMERKEAKSIAFRSEEFFVRLFDIFGDKALLVEAYAGDALVSSCVFLRSARELWFAYSGTVLERLNSGAHTFAVDQVIQWAAANGIDYVFLGGGVNPGDSLQRSKTGFSHLTASTRHLRKVHNPRHLEYLCEAKARYNSSLGKPIRTDYFPSYWLD
jgi:serine/alanine adding enzyme